MHMLSISSGGLLSQSSSKQLKYSMKSCRSAKLNCDFVSHKKKSVETYIAAK